MGLDISNSNSVQDLNNSLGDVWRSDLCKKSNVIRDSTRASKYMGVEKSKETASQQVCRAGV